MPARPAGAPRSLADDLRARDDAQLLALLRGRPDLTAPVPADITSLAARAATRASVGRALDALDAFTLRAVDVLAVLPEPASRTELARLLGVRPGVVAEPVDRLRELGLLWGRDGALRLVRTVRDAVGPHPAGLGPPLADLLARRDPGRLHALGRDLAVPSGDGTNPAAALAAHLADAEVLTDLLGRAPDGVRDVLDRLTWGPPVGAVPRADRDVDVDTARSPIEWLLAHGLLGVADAGHVVLPREVALHLRGGRVHAEPAPEPPALRAAERPLALVDRAAGSAAAELLRLVGELLEAWSVQPPPVLRSGGLGVRELRRTATTLDVDEETAAFVIELAYAAGLVADDGEADPTWAPTPAYDAWLEDDASQAWATLAEAWRASTRASGLVGSRDDRGAVRGPLASELDRPLAREVRSRVLAELADTPEGAAPDLSSLLDRLRWRRPRRAGRLQEDLVRWTLREAELLGVTGRGALSTPGRVLARAVPGPPADDLAPALAAPMAPLLPTPVDHVLLQADLTAVAPGPLEAGLGRLMALAADVESRGGATVFRFSAGSVRRALDAGWTAADLVTALAEGSRTPVPQPLEYLVHDVARRHGRVRVGAASSYVRSDDESTLRELVADRRAASLRLRQLAPTVLAAQADPSTVLAVLREVGLAPAAESADGDVLVRRPDAHRTPPRQPPRPLGADPAPPADALLAAVVRALRLGQRSADEEPPRVGPRLAPTDPAVTLATLREAVAGRQRVWIGYADGSGRVDRRVVEPLTVDGGRVTAFDHATDEVRDFSVHRVTGVAVADDPA
ncbi:MAG TPA: helicase C-terminal domain-containing protein [Actinomycetales bacterium]|nr:helicase C-terminal domain-containing protein [Actinomycetales bacterium]